MNIVLDERGELIYQGKKEGFEMASRILGIKDDDLIYLFGTEYVEDILSIFDPEEIEEIFKLYDSMTDIRKEAWSRRKSI